MKKYVYITLGIVSLALGMIGVLLPVMPTTPFLILAAYFFARSSQRMHRWLLDLPAAGPLIRDWEQHRSVKPHIKWVAIAMVLTTATTSFIFIGHYHYLLRPLLVVLTSIGILVIWRIPSRSPAQNSDSL